MGAIPGSDDAVIVLNVLSDDATVLRMGAGGLESPDDPRRRARRERAGRLRRRRLGDRLDRRAPHQERRSERGLPGPHRHQAGRRRRRRQSCRPASGPSPSLSPPTASKAFAVTEDGITVVDLGGAAGPRVSKNVIITDDATENVDTRDVSLTPNGGLAVIRREGNAAIGIVDLATSVRSTITLSGPVTDLDLTSDGKRAVAVVRDTAEVAILPLDARRAQQRGRHPRHRHRRDGRLGRARARRRHRPALLERDDARADHRADARADAQLPGHQAARAGAVGIPGRGRANAVVLHADTRPTPAQHNDRLGRRDDLRRRR